MKIKIILILFILALNLSRAAVVLPERFKNSKIIIVNSPEYNEAVNQNIELKQQIELENKNWMEYSKVVDEQIKYNGEIQSQLLNDYNKQKLTLSEKETIIIKQRLHNVLLLSTIGAIFVILGALFYFGIIRIGVLPFR